MITYNTPKRFNNTITLFHRPPPLLRPHPPHRTQRPSQSIGAAGSMFLAPLILLATASVALAQDPTSTDSPGNFSAPCDQKNTKLSFGNYQLSSDCDSAFYCADNSTCANKGCRRQVFPFGYGQNDTLPPFCGDGNFCPDEEDQCLPLLPVGSPCQLNRDGTPCGYQTRFGVNVMKKQSYLTIAF